MSLTVAEQAEKIIKHADENGTAAINEEDFSGEDCPVESLIESLIKSIAERNKGDILLAVGSYGTVDLTNGFPDDGLAEIQGGGCGSGLGCLIFLFVSFTGEGAGHFVKNEMETCES